MIYSVDFMGLTEKINPLAFAKYLRDTGWKNIPVKKSYLKIFQITSRSGESFQVDIPMDKELLDYKSAMYQAVETAAHVEGQSAEGLMLFLLNPNTDILKIRLDRKDVEAGNILLDDALRVYESAKKLIAAAARDVLHPKACHQGRMDDAVIRFMNSCRFGQTEIGSYIVPVVCPFAELDETAGYRQLSIFSEEEQCASSLTRQVTNRIMANISSIKEHIDNGDYDRLLPDGGQSPISVNFYEALAGLNLDAEGADVEFIAQWSPAVMKNRYSKDRVALSHDYYQPIVNAIGRIRGSAKAKVKIIGRVKGLDSAPDVSKRVSGRVVVVYLDKDEKKKTITANLTREDYDRAIDAHRNGDHVELIGEIENPGSRRASILCEAFNIIE